jgi:hypothetical protein
MTVSTKAYTSASSLIDYGRRRGAKFWTTAFEKVTLKKRVYILTISSLSAREQPKKKTNYRKIIRACRKLLAAPLLWRIASLLGYIYKTLA